MDGGRQTADGREKSPAHPPAVRRPSSVVLRPPSAPDDLAAFLAHLSTRALFLRFTQEFLPQRGGRAFAWEAVPMAGDEVGFRLRLQDAMEFIGKMSYTDNWQSELQEEFCFWEFREWQAAFEAAGFRVLEGSHAYTNEWRVRNRFAGRVALYDLAGNPLPFPSTNMVIAGEKE
jgi:hypothetical protein